MSSLRYCGELRIRLTYVDWRQSDVYSDGTPRNRNGQYRCHVRQTNGSGNGVTVWVGAPSHLTHAVDSSEAFDSAAHAALSFASDDGYPVESYVSYHECGVWDIKRKPVRS